MGGSDQRRLARRQPRGLERADAILAASGELFAEIGYDAATAGKIADRAGVSVGSLYQFFPNKEAIAEAYARVATARLLAVYDATLEPAAIAQPLAALVDAFLDRIVAFNLEFPGYFALSMARAVSPPFAAALAELRREIDACMDALYAAIRPDDDPERRRVAGLVSYRLFLAVLPLLLASGLAERQRLVRELKLVFVRYWSADDPVDQDVGA